MLCVAAVDGWQSYVFLACVICQLRELTPYSQTNYRIICFKVLLILTVLAG